MTAKHCGKRDRHGNHQPHDWFNDPDLTGNVIKNICPGGPAPRFCGSLREHEAHEWKGFLCSGPPVVEGGNIGAGPIHPPKAHR